jgi:hypothetical protein
MPLLLNRDFDGPGTHALVIGVSSYPHVTGGTDPTPLGESFQLQQLSTAARSASEFAGWLLNEYHNERAPLKSLRVLLSPSATETLNPAVQALFPEVNGCSQAYSRTSRISTCT